MNTVLYPKSESCESVARLLGIPSLDASQHVAMPTERAILDTVKIAADTQGVLHFGYRGQPRIDVLARLAAMDGSVQIVSVNSVETDWVWVSDPGAQTSPVRMSLAAFRDIDSMGQELPPEFVVSDVELRDAQASSRIVERSSFLRPRATEIAEVRAFRTVVDFATVRRADGGSSVSRSTYGYFVVRPDSESVGSLGDLLSRLARHGINLDYIASHEVAPGLHEFFLGAQIGADAANDAVHDALAGSRVNVTPLSAGLAPSRTVR